MSPKPVTFRQAEGAYLVPDQLRKTLDVAQPNARCTGKLDNATTPAGVTSTRGHRPHLPTIGV